MGVVFQNGGFRNEIDRLMRLIYPGGWVRRILEIDLERPRDSMSRPFLEMRKEVLGLLGGG